MRTQGLARLCAAAAVAVSGFGIAFAASSSVHAAGVNIVVQDSQFVPARKVVGLGVEVTWTFEDKIRHDTHSRQEFWASALKSSGDTYRHTFTSAGRYAYVCDPHETFMTGLIIVPLQIATNSVDYTVRWAAFDSTGPNRRYDVQIKRPGADTWAVFRADTSAERAVLKNPAAGTYRFRARTENLVAGKSSGWSPVARFTVS